MLCRCLSQEHEEHDDKMEGYEQIGAWNVSLVLPQEAREALRTYFGLLKEKRVPLPVILSDDFWFNDAAGKVKYGKSPKESLEARLEVGTKLEIPNGRLSYIDHHFLGSTVVLVENPFVPIGNLYWGENHPVRDYRTDPPQNAWVREYTKNPISKEAGALRLSNGEAWCGTTLWLNSPLARETIAKWKSSGFPVPDEVLGVTVVAAYKFLAVMDWQKLEARIEPFPDAAKV